MAREVARPDEVTVAMQVCPGGPIDVCDVSQLMATWLPRLGPTSTLAWHWLAQRAVDPDRAPVVIADLGAAIGCAPWAVWKAIDRLITFGRIVWLNGDTLGVEVVTDRPRPPRTVPT
jgi:hypothetical protein